MEHLLKILSDRIDFGRISSFDFLYIFFTRASALIMRNLEGGSSRWTSFLMFYAKKTARLPLCSKHLRFSSGKTVYKNLSLALKAAVFFRKSRIFAFENWFFECCLSLKLSRVTRFVCFILFCLTSRS